MIEVLSQVVAITPESEMYNLAGFGFFAEVLAGGHVPCMQKIVSEFWTKNRICRWNSSSGTHILSDLGQVSHILTSCVFLLSRVEKPSGDFAHRCYSV